MERVILHSDMNGFYASVECLYNPATRNKPAAVCGSVEERHGTAHHRSNITLAQSIDERIFIKILSKLIRTILTGGSFFMLMFVQEKYKKSSKSQAKAWVYAVLRRSFAYIANED